MTDEQIIKALECCEKHGDCKECPLNGKDIKGCMFVLMRDTLALIKRQREKIEEQQQDIFYHKETISNLLAQIITFLIDIDVLTKKARAEAIREFEKEVVKLFPSDKKFTTISRASILQITRKLAEEQK